MHRSRSIAAFCGLVLVIAGLLWWSSEVSAPPSAPDSSRSERGATGQIQAQLGSEAEDAPGEDQRQLISPLAPNPTEETGSLLLKAVYGEDQSPVVDALMVVRYRSIDGPRPPARRVETDAEGEARVTGLLPGKVWVTAVHRSASNNFADPTDIVAGEEAELTLTFEDGVDLECLVVDSEGVPVAGASIFLDGLPPNEPEIVGQTDDEGRFQIRQVTRMSNVSARAIGHAPSFLHTITAGSGSLIRMRIALPGPGGGLRGQVLGPDGQGVVDATVQVGDRGRAPYAMITLPDGSSGMDPRAGQGLTGAEGRFELIGLAPGESPVSALSREHAPWTGSVTILPHVTTPLTIRLGSGVTCTGTVTVATGDAVGGVEILHGDYFSPSHRRTTTSADGTFRLEGLPPGSIRLRAQSDDRGIAETTLRAGAGETVQWNATLSLGLVLQARVLDGNGEPLEDVLVEANGSYDRETESMWSRYARTNTDGEFTLANCPEGEELALTLQKLEYAPLSRRVYPSEGPHVFHMTYEGEPAGRIVGTLLDPDGKPIGDAMVLVDGGVSTTAAGTGEIEVDGLRPGVYSLYIRARDYPVYRLWDYALGTGETWDLGTIQLVRGGWMQPTVRDSRKDTAVPVYFSIHDRDGRFTAGVDTRTKPYATESLIPGRYELRISGPDTLLDHVPFSVTEGQTTEVEVHVRPGVPMILEIASPEGIEVKNLEFSVTGPNGFRFARQFSRVFSPYQHKMGLAPGRYVFQAQTQEGYTAQHEFDVDAAAPQTIRVMLR